MKDAVYIWIVNDREANETWRQRAVSIVTESLAGPCDPGFTRMETARRILAESLRNTIERGNPIDRDSLEPYRTLLGWALSELNWQQLASDLLAHYGIDIRR